MTRPKARRHNKRLTRLRTRQSPQDPQVLLDLQVHLVWVWLVEPVQVCSHLAVPPQWWWQGLRRRQGAEFQGVECEAMKDFKVKMEGNVEERWRRSWTPTDMAWEFSDLAKDGVLFSKKQLRERGERRRKREHDIEREFVNRTYLGGICKQNLGPSNSGQNSIMNLKFLCIVYPNKEF